MRMHDANKEKGHLVDACRDDVDLPLAYINDEPQFFWRPSVRYSPILMQVAVRLSALLACCHLRVWSRRR
jgi:hypothetical protein